jgi:hypothetical protein
VRDDGCVVVKCADGYVDKYCPADMECKSYYDSDGCLVKTCSDGTTERECYENITCESYEREDGCVVDRCSDGSYSIYCPAGTEIPDNAYSETCTDIYDDEGFLIGVKCESRYAEQVPIFTEHCLTDSEVQRKVEACVLDSDGIAYIEYLANGCQQVICETEEETPPSEVCEEQPYDEIRALKDRCYGAGGEVRIDFDSRGCEKYVCSLDMAECRTEADIPDEKYDYCEETGGKLIVRSDEDGCLELVECVGGEEYRHRVIEVEDVPDSSKLLELALQLESLKLEFDGIIERLKALSAYYGGQGDTEESEKFLRAAEMFETAKDEIDSIKEFMRENLDSFDAEMAKEVKQRVRYLKDVIIKDILFVILGGESEGEEDCTTEACFQRALRACKKASYSLTEGNMTMEVEIAGLENGLCVVEAGMNDGTSDYEMTCKIPDFAKETLDDTVLEQHCEGTLVGYIKGETKQTTTKEGKAVQGKTSPAVSAVTTATSSAIAGTTGGDSS